VGNYAQVFKNIHPDQHIKIKEGIPTINSAQPRPIHFPHSGQNLVDCPPE
jgi:hypothetical protein